MGLPLHDASGLDAVVREINARDGTDLAIVQRLGGSVNSGAAIVTGSAGRRVLKWVRPGHSLEAQRNAGKTTAVLRANGYPMPIYERIEPLGESGYVLMTELPGVPADFRAHGPALVARILALNRSQRAAAVLPGRWPAEIIAGVIDGGDGYCFPRAKREHSTSTAALLETLQALARDHADAPTSRDGIVHKDLNPGNVLATDGDITGVVDWENTCSGDPAYDIAYLWFCIYHNDACRPLLWRHLTTVDPRTVALCVAHVICGFVSGAIEHGNHWLPARLAAAPRALEHLRSVDVRVRGMS